FLAAIILFPPDALRRTALDVVATLASVSNIRFWKEANEYFAPNFQTVPLLHSWSLGVEDQFYLIWPAALLFEAKVRRPLALPAFIFAASIVSLILAQVWLAKDAAAAFYLMQFRIFELGIGALCLWAEGWQPRRGISAESLFVLGIAAILLSMIAFDA